MHKNLYASFKCTHVYNRLFNNFCCCSERNNVLQKVCCSFTCSYNYARRYRWTISIIHLYFVCLWGATTPSVRAYLDVFLNPFIKMKQMKFLFFRNFHLNFNCFNYPLHILICCAILPQFNNFNLYIFFKYMVPFCGHTVILDFDHTKPKITSKSFRYIVCKWRLG